MKSIRDNNIILIRLHPKENVIDSLISISKKYHLKTGVILSGIGQLTAITLGYFKEKGDYQDQFFSNTYELLSLNGSIIQQHSTYLPHIHCVIGDMNKQTYGGHLIGATVKVTNEIVIMDTNLPAFRTKSESTGLMDLDFDIIE
jgi:predicted DNA-binding protein with PD1-like motif